MSLPALWVGELPAHEPQAWGKLLSEAEKARAAGMGSPRRRLQFLAARVLLRQALSRELGGDPQSFAISAEAGSPPRLASSSLFLSISHSGSKACCLVAGEPCGVDIEDGSRVRDFRALADYAFDAAEKAAFQKNPTAEGFYARWTAKEARYKAASPCAWLGRLSLGDYRLAAVTRLTGLKTLVICSHPIISEVP